MCPCRETYLDDMEGLVHGSLGVKREARVNFRRHFAGNDIKDLLAELDKQAVESGINLRIEGRALLLALCDGSVGKAGVFGLLGGSKDQRGIGGGILGLVFADG